MPAHPSQARSNPSSPLPSRSLTLPPPLVNPKQQILLATMPDVRPLASLLRSLSFRQQATLKIDKIGLRFTVEEGRGLQAHAYINASAFSSYAFALSPTDDAARFDDPPPASPASSPGSSPAPAEPDPDKVYAQTLISLSTLLECLNIFGNAGGAGLASSSGGGRFRREGTAYDDEDGYGGGGRRRRQGREGEDEREEAPPSKERTSLRISYKGLGEPLVLLLEESGIVTRCELTTYEPDGLLDLAFPDDERVVRLVMKSEWLRDALHELPTSSEKITISFAPPHLVQRQRQHGSHHPHPPSRYKRRRVRGSSVFDGLEDDAEEEEGEEEEVPLFRLESTGTLGSTEMDYSNDGDVLEVFECDAPVRNSYKYSHVQLTNKALNSSIKTSIRTAPSGLVSFQFMIPLGPTAMRAGSASGGGGGRGGRESTGGGGVREEEKVGFVEFLVVALDEDAYA
ncbi:hypothetical protein JCM8097_006170 [Rhodosporidiobolus ruineniae]